MDFNEFKKRIASNQMLRVMMLELDKRYPIKLYMFFVGAVLLLLAFMGAVTKYFESRATYGLEYYDSFGYAAFFFFEFILAIAAIVFVCYLVSAFIISWIKAIIETRSSHMCIDEVKQTEQQEAHPVNQQLLSQYLSSKFKGMGANLNYMPQLLHDLEILQKTSPTEVQRFAVMLYESKVMVNKPTQFKEWIKIFFNIVGVEHPKYISRSKHKPTPEMINRYYYINLP